MTVGSGSKDTVAAALNQLVLTRVILHYETNFFGGRNAGARPQVTVWIRAQDELTIARVKRKVEAAIRPFVPGALIQVYADPPRTWP